MIKSLITFRIVQNKISICLANKMQATLVSLAVSVRCPNRVILMGVNYEVAISLHNREVLAVMANKFLFNWEDFSGVKLVAFMVSKHELN